MGDLRRSSDSGVTVASATVARATVGGDSGRRRPPERFVICHLSPGDALTIPNTQLPTGASPDLTPCYAPLAPGRLRSAKAAYTTRHVDMHAVTRLLTGVPPRVGDLVLARVAAIGQHPKIELAHGRRAAMFVGDEIIVAYGNRYAPDQFEAELPEDLGPCELVAAGGIAGRVIAAHGLMSAATGLEPIGLLADAAGNRVTLRSGVLAAPPTAGGNRPLTIAVVGASMNSGKTTVAAHLVRGLRLAGIEVGAAKTTGTGAGGDVWLLSDAGAFPVYDFTNAGYASTYRIGPDAVRDVFTGLTDRLAADGCEVVVLEVADGVFQEETAGLLVDPVFTERVDAVLFATRDALGASAGVNWLRERGPAPIAVCGVLSSSPLAIREAEAATSIPVWGLAQLSDPGAARALYEGLRGGRAPRLTGHSDPAGEAALSAHTSPSNDRRLRAVSDRRPSSAPAPRRESVKVRDA